MIEVDDHVADAERREFGEEGVRALAAFLTADKTFAEDVLFGEQADRVGGEAVVEGEDDEGDVARLTQPFVPVRVERSRDTRRGGAVLRGVSTSLDTNGTGTQRLLPRIGLHQPRHTMLA